MSTASIVPIERIQDRILVLRGQRVLLDTDLAVIFDVSTKQLNQAVKRNIGKFPEDFMFGLNADEWEAIKASRSQPVTKNMNRSQFVTGSIKHRGSRILPNAFTEHGTIQAANVLRSDTAVQMSVQVVRAFVQLRQMVVNHKAIRSKLSELDARIGEHDEQLAAIVETLHQLAEPVSPDKKRRIGF